MTDQLANIEKITNILQLRANGQLTPPDFDRYTNHDLAVLLARFAAEYAAQLDQTGAA